MVVLLNIRTGSLGLAVLAAVCLFACDRPECTDDGPCRAAGQVCVDEHCMACDPTNSHGCEGSPERPICAPTGDACQPCSAHQECRLKPGDDDYCAEGRCGDCDPVGQQHWNGCPDEEPVCARLTMSCRPCNVAAECGPDWQCDDGACVRCRLDAADVDCRDPQASICDAETRTCRACMADAECGDAVCFNGTCRECLRDVDCPMDVPICDIDLGVCRSCRGDAECDPDEVCASPADTLAGQCIGCEPSENRGCDPNRDAPVCDALTRTCRPCQAPPDLAPGADPLRAADAECAGNINGSTCVQGFCQVCDPATHRGCPDDAARSHTQCVDWGARCAAPAGPGPAP